MGKINSLRLRDRSLHNAMEAKEEDLKVLENTVSEQRMHRQQLEAQLTTPLKTSLSPEEISETDNLRNIIHDTDSQLLALIAQVRTTALLVACYNPQGPQMSCLTLANNCVLFTSRLKILLLPRGNWKMPCGLTWRSSKSNTIELSMPMMRMQKSPS